MSAVDWVKLIEPTPEQLERHGPTCDRRQPILEPCEHIAISAEALQVLRAKLGATDATGREASDRKIEVAGEQGRDG